MIKYYTIYGERCSGTNYLQDIISKNFDIEITWKYGWKHFFGFLDKKLKDSDDTLFICIVRDPIDWIDSFFRNPFHLPRDLRMSLNNFLNNIFYSESNTWSCRQYYGNKCNKLGEDRNIYTGVRYKNIFELRHTKIKWMLDDLPNKIKNYIFIRYEDLINDFENTMIKIKNKGLKVKKNIDFPINSNNYKNKKNTTFIKKKIPSSIKNKIMNNPNLIKTYEKKLGYI